jgi:hypothetical protein
VGTSGQVADGSDRLADRVHLGAIAELRAGAMAGAVDSVREGTAVGLEAGAEVEAGASEREGKRRGGIVGPGLGAVDQVGAAVLGVGPVAGKGELRVVDCSTRFFQRQRNLDRSN